MAGQEKLRGFRKPKERMGFDESHTAIHNYTVPEK